MKIEIIRKAQKELRDIKKSHSYLLDKIISVIRKIGENPYLRGGRKLTNYDEYKIRIGDYRILYRIDMKNSTVTIVSIGHRKDVYKKL